LGCKKDLCIQCRILLDIDPWTGETNLGDHLDALCGVCNDKLKPYKKKAQVLQNELEDLYLDWLAKCKKN
jgi:hypothetical protein